MLFRKKKADRICCFFTICFVCLFCSKVFAMSYAEIKSPKISSTRYHDVVNETGTKIIPEVVDYSFELSISSEDNRLNLKYTRPDGSYKKDDFLFVFVYDIKNNLIDRAYFSGELRRKSATVNLPYQTDFAIIDIYQQKEGDPLWKTEGNFLGRTTYISPANEQFKRNNGTSTLTKIPVNDQLYERETNFLFVRNTPNLYSLRCYYSEDWSDDDYSTFLESGNIGLIVLPKGCENKLTEKQKVCPRIYYDENFDDEHGTLVQRTIFEYNFYLPDGIDEFEFYVYKDEIKEEKLMSKYKIKLKKL